MQKENQWSMTSLMTREQLDVWKFSNDLHCNEFCGLNLEDGGKKNYFSLIGSVQ